MLEANIEVDRPSNWLVLSVESEKMICSSFGGCFIPFYECFFTRLNLWLPLNEFKEETLRFLNISNLQLHPSAWTLIKVFQTWDDIDFGSPHTG